MIKKRGQEQKGKILVAKPKRAQEEMVGFALIVVIVAVIMLIFLGFSIKGGILQKTQSYEVESFLQALLQTTTECEDYSEYLSVKDLIFDCHRDQTCLDGRQSCDVLEETMENLIAESWQIQGDRPVKAYFLNISSNSDALLMISEGNITKSSKSAFQGFSRSGSSLNILLKVYY